MTSHLSHELVGMRGIYLIGLGMFQEMVLAIIPVYYTRVIIDNRQKKEIWVLFGYHMIGEDVYIPDMRERKNKYIPIFVMFFI